MRILAFLLLLSVSAFGQGVAVRSLNGKATNLSIVGSVTGAPLFRIVATPTNSYAAAPQMGLAEVFGNDGFRYLDFGANTNDGASQFGLINVFGAATNSTTGRYANILGFNVWNTRLAGDSRGWLSRVKVPGGNTNGGAYYLIQVAYDPTGGGGGDALIGDADTTFANTVWDQYGNVALGYLNDNADPSAGATPSFGQYSLTRLPAKVNLFASPYRSWPLLYLDPCIAIVDVPVSNTVENAGTRLYFTDSTSARKVLATMTTNEILTITNQISTPSLTISGGSPTAGKVWTSVDTSGLGAWSNATAGGSSFPLTGNVSGGGNTITNLSQMGTETWIDVVKDFGATGDGVTDDTAAIQNAINFGVKTNNGYTVTLYFRPGIYIISGALQQTGAGLANAQLIVPPSTNTTATSDASIRFLGPAYKANYSGTSAQGMGTNGATLRSSLTNEGASVLRSGGTTNTYNGRVITIENLGWQAPTDSRATVLNLREFGWSRLYNVTVTVPWTPGTATPQPATNSVGINMPKDAFAHSWWRDVEVAGYWWGANITEHLNGDDLLFINNGNAGLNVLGGTHANRIGRMYTTGCRYGILGSGTGYLDVDLWEIERQGTNSNPIANWRTNEFDVIDSNNLFGTIRFKAVDLADVTKTDLAKKSGAENVAMKPIKYPSMVYDFNTSATEVWRRGISVQRNIGNAGEGGMHFLKSRGTPDARTAVSSADGVGMVGWWGWDGNSWECGAYDDALVKGTVADGSVPMLRQFLTGSAFAGNTVKLTLGTTGGMTTNHQPVVFQFEVKSPTNVANFNLATNFLAINTKYTNNATLIGQRRSLLWVDVTLTPSATDAAQVSIFVDQDADGTYEENYNTIKDGALTGATASIRHFMDTLQPGAFFVVTNQSSGTATATVLSSKLTGF